MFGIFKKDNRSEEEKDNEKMMNGISIIVDGIVKEEDKSVVGRAVVGGLLFGPLGAVVGGMSGVGKKEKVEKINCKMSMVEKGIIFEGKYGKEFDVKVKNESIVDVKEVGNNKFEMEVKGGESIVFSVVSFGNLKRLKRVMERKGWNKEEEVSEEEEWL